MRTAMVAAAVLLSTPARAAQLRLVVPTDTMAVGQTVFAELQVINGEPADLPEIPTSGGLRAQVTGTSQSMTAVNFQTTRTLTYNLAVTALRKGTWTLGPVSAIVDGERLLADPVSFTVTPRSAAEQARASVTASLSDEAPFVGEVEVYHFAYRRSISTYSDELSPLVFDGFMQVSDAEEGRASYELVEDGQRVRVDEIDFPLEALHPGSHTLAPAVLTARVADARQQQPDRRGGLFGRARSTRLETFSTDAIGVDVRPLPAAGRPADFSGLVGRFTLRARASERTLPLGESVTLEVRLVGDGRLSGVKLPPLSGDGFQVYDDNPDYAAGVIDGRYQARATFRRAIVPAQVGAVTIPPVELTAFDPDAERYVTLRTEPITLNVTAGEEGAGEVTSFSGGDGRQDVEALGDDILPAPGGARIRDRRLGAVLPWLLAAPAVPSLALVGLLLRRRKPEVDPRAALRDQLATLPDDPAARLLALEAVFRDACGLRLGVPGPAVTRDRVAELGEDTAALDEALSRARYGGAAAVSGLEAQVRAFVEAT